MRVAFTREKYGVDAPATCGHPEWERYFRVQQNSLEQLIVFLSALWIFATFVSAWMAAAIGCLFFVVRMLYFVTYVKDPKTRAVGFVMGFLANVGLLIGGVIGMISKLI